MNDKKRREKCKRVAKLKRELMVLQTNREKTGIVQLSRKLDLLLSENRQ